MLFLYFPQQSSTLLQAIKSGFTEGLAALSEEAAPFLSLLSHTDWRVLLCGETTLSAHHVVAACSFSGFPARSRLPEWLKELLLSLSDDLLRKFLVFVTGSPSLPASFHSQDSSTGLCTNWMIKFIPFLQLLCFLHLICNVVLTPLLLYASFRQYMSSLLFLVPVRINVRHLPRSNSLPVAHTCFFHLDIPDYRDRDTLHSKLLYAFQNANTFEIV
jgi:hypothetical protein